MLFVPQPHAESGGVAPALGRAAAVLTHGNEHRACWPFRRQPFPIRARSAGSSAGSSSVAVFQTMPRSISKYPWIRRLRIDTIDCQGTSGARAALRRNPDGSFPGDFDGPNDREQQLSIVVQIAALAPLDEIADGLDGFHHMEDPDAVVRPHTALRPSAAPRCGNAD